MLRLPFCCLLLLAGLSSCKISPADHPDAAKSQLDSTTFTSIGWKAQTVHFGTINMGEKTRILFEFSNTGKLPLFLTEVKPGCGCTVAEYTKGAIPAGGKGTITAEFDSNKAHPGTVSKNIFVTANTGNGVSHTLTFTGEIKEMPSTGNQ